MLESWISVCFAFKNDEQNDISESYSKNMFQYKCKCKERINDKL